MQGVDAEASGIQHLQGPQGRGWRLLVSSLQLSAPGPELNAGGLVIRAGFLRG